MAAMAAITNNSNWQIAFKTTHSRLLFLLENEALSDVVFIVGDIEKERIFAHKLILMMGSVVFQQMFSSGNQFFPMKTEIMVPDISPNIFRAILKFLYTDKIDFDIGDVDHIMNLLIACNTYKLSQLTAQCNAILISAITEKNAISIYQLAILLGQDELSEFAFSFICRKPKKVFSVSELCTLSKENLKRLARCDALNIDEMDLFKAAVKWAKGTCLFRKTEPTKDNLRDVLKDIIPHIRFLLMTAEEISLYVVTLNLLTDEELVHIYRHCTLSSNLRSSTTTSSFFNPKPRSRYWVAERFSSTSNRTCWKNKARGWLCKPKWQTISFKVDQPISVVAIGLYGESSVSVGEYFGTCKPYSYEVRIYNDASQMLSCKGNALENPGKLVYAHFDKPVPILSNKWYNIACKIRSNTGSFVGEGGRSHLKVSCGNSSVNFNFKNTANFKIVTEPEEEKDKEDDSTNVRGGDIPEIAFCLSK